uniref:HSF-type DNA-binding domain-containing protein n=1 Tax=Romanomermis culicivorax TaxID=13658 RepID=A0A915JY21_ROMCU
MPGQAPTESSIPNFLLKLWRLVEDEQFQNCIGWDETGYSFHVCEPYMFSKSVLPLYFKHSNLNSFIRQLNMYGFRKVNNFDKGALKQQNDVPQQTPQQHDTLEFQHPYFVRGHAEMLQYIKRKVAASSRLNGSATTNTAGTEHMDQSVVAGGSPVVNGSCVAYHSQSSVDAVSCPGLIT